MIFAYWHSDITLNFNFWIYFKLWQNGIPKTPPPPWSLQCLESKVCNGWWHTWLLTNWLHKWLLFPWDLHWVLSSPILDNISTLDHRTLISFYISCCIIEIQIDLSYSESLEGLLWCCWSVWYSPLESQFCGIWIIEYSPFIWFMLRKKERNILWWNKYGF